MSAPAPGSRRLPATAVVGAAAGFLSGLFGVGGGILIVPGLVLVLGMAQRLAHGTSLAAVLPIAVSSLIGYATHDKVDWVAGLWLALGSVVGAILGTYLLHRLSQVVLTMVFSALLIATAVRLLADHSTALGRAPLSVLGAVALVLVGALTGVLAGLLGVGGGIVMVPALVLGFGLPAAVAKGTSLMVIAPTALMGTLQNRRRTNVDFSIAVVAGLAGVAFAFVGSKFSVDLSERTASVSFAILLLAFGVGLLANLARTRGAAYGDQT